MNATANQNDCDFILKKIDNNKSNKSVVNNNQLHSIVQLQNVTTSINSTSYFSKNNHNQQQPSLSTKNKNDTLMYKSNNATIVPNGYLIYGGELSQKHFFEFGWICFKFCLKLVFRLQN